ECSIQCTEAVDVICIHLPAVTNPEEEANAAEALSAYWNQERDRILASNLTCVVDATAVEYKSLPILRLFARMAKDLATIGRELRVECPLAGYPEPAAAAS